MVIYYIIYIFFYNIITYFPIPIRVIPRFLCIAYIAYSVYITCIIIYTHVYERAQRNGKERRKEVFLSSQILTP